MYQSVYYNYKNRNVFIRDDNEGWFNFTYNPKYYKLDDNGEYTTLDGKKVKEVDRVVYGDLNYYEQDVDKTLSVLLEIYREEDSIPKVHNRVFLDIETVMGGAINLPYCISAPSRITAIALYDENTKKYYAFVENVTGKSISSPNDEVTIVPCDNEYDLLSNFLDKWTQLDPTIVCGWNSDNFDIPYLYNRMKKLLGREKADSLSPIGIVDYDERDNKMPFKIAGVNCMDYLRLYKKFIPRQQPSYSLNDICLKEIGKGKILYEGSLDKLFKEDIDKFIEYNINDVRLIVELDQKKKFLDLAIMICHLSHVPYQYVYQSSKVVEGCIMTYLKRKNIISPNRPSTNNPELKKVWDDNLDDDEEDEKFAGAYVKDPIPGLYSWNFDLDIESEYPSAGILLNAGIETFIFKIVIEDKFDDSWNLKELKLKDPNKIVQIEKIDGTIRDISIGALIKIIEKNDICISPNGVGFDSKSNSVLVEVMVEWFKKRKEFKQLMLQFGKAGDKKSEEFYDLYQQVMKVFLNSIYGCLGLPSFRYSDGKDYLASAITACGRKIIMTSADMANEKICAECDTDKDYVIMSDTDSLYLEACDILKNRFPGIDLSNDAEVIENLRPIAKEFSDYLNNFYEQEFTKSYFNSSNNRVKIKSETIAKTLYVSAKKQYAQYIVDKEGITKEDFDFKGLDGMKSSFPPLYRKFYQKLIKDILFNTGKSKIDKDILDFREKFKTLSINEIAKPSGINKNLKEYVLAKPIKGTIFSRIASGTAAHIKAAIHYNDLLKFKNLDKMYAVIQVGDKMKWVYLAKNPYNIEVLAISQYDTPEEILNYANKYIDKDAMFEGNLVKKLQKIYDNLSWGTINFNKNVNKFFKFI
jgi:DNA polymerase elongation subunit (family B)